MWGVTVQRRGLLQKKNQQKKWGGAETYSYSSQTCQGQDMEGKQASASRPGNSMRDPQKEEEVSIKRRGGKGVVLVSPGWSVNYSRIRQEGGEIRFNRGKGCWGGGGGGWGGQRTIEREKIQRIQICGGNPKVEMLEPLKKEGDPTPKPTRVCRDEELEILANAGFLGVSE